MGSSKMIACRFLVLLACFAGLNAALIGRSVGASKCPVVTTKPDFEIEKYLGVWYEITKLPNVFQGDMYCVSAVYTPRAEGGINVNKKASNQTDQIRVFLVGPNRTILPTPEHWISSSLAVRLEIIWCWIPITMSSPSSIRAAMLVSSRSNSVGCWPEHLLSALKLFAKARAGFEKYGINFDSFKPTRQDSCNY